MKPFSLPQGIALCLISGLLVVFSFPSFLDKSMDPWGAPLVWLSLIPFFLALETATPRRGALLGWVFGLVQFGGILYWVALLKEASYLSVPGWLALTLYLSLYPAVFGFFSAWWRPRSRLFFWFASPALWITIEFIRGHYPWGGFPWGELGYACAPDPSLLVLTSYVGVSGLTFLIVWVNGLGAQAIVQWRQGSPVSSKRIIFRYVLLPALVAAGWGGYGHWKISKAHLISRGRIALVQPNIDQSVKWNRAYAADTYHRLEKWTRAAGREHPDLILWPETAAPSFLLWSPDDLRRVSGIVREAGSSVLVGCLDMLRIGKSGEADFNAAVQFEPDGRWAGIYRKRHLVPFGEFVPFQKYLKFLGPVVGNLGSFQPGPAYCRFRAGIFSYSPVICYEAIFPDDIRRAVAGADVLVNISNDAWYGRTACAYQHASMAVLRSAEEEKPLFRCANTGVSLATDPFGRILGKTSIYQEALLTEPVYSVPGSTFYFKWGHWFSLICLVWTLMGLGIGFFRRRETFHA